ncbi:DUF262 domain-containing protein [Lactococcus lactis]|uniref:GmrSD restriction endonuclease domain-containing protein n=1 Tax=Lactococcus lactis TaxID=1358 RepID=UPI0025A10D6F|nr:DUF262 domain-containing protein [Lactococcus lactis]MDM7538276.1 DUF262 domain-containing protein [Lactococcus lactis]MDN5644485.1 DUF262 domain-containing protein [Acinetobacter sp.]
MKISPELKRAARYNPTKKSYQITIFDLCEKISHDKLTLPLYQRDVSWHINKAVDLLNYQLFGKAPISPISINQISNGISVPQVSFIDRELIDTSTILADHLSIVDGQQRLSTNFKAYTNHPDFRNIFLDVSKAKFRIIDSEFKKSHIPVGILLNKNADELQEYLEKNGTFKELYSTLIDVRGKIKDYNYTMNVADNLSEDEQIEWFEVLNNAGSRVTALQISFSKLKMYDFDIYKDYISIFNEKISEYGLDNIYKKISTRESYPIAALNPSYEVAYKKGNHNSNFAPISPDAKGKLLATLEIEDLKKIVSSTLISLEQALDFISEENLLEKVSRVDYILYLTGLYSFRKNRDLSLEEKKGIAEWFNKVTFSDSNQTRRKIFTELINEFR